MSNTEPDYSPEHLKSGWQLICEKSPHIGHMLQNALRRRLTMAPLEPYWLCRDYYLVKEGLRLAVFHSWGRPVTRANSALVAATTRMERDQVVKALYEAVANHVQKRHKEHAPCSDA